MPAPAFPTESTTLLLDGPAGALEVAVDLSDCPPRPAIAIVCHPLPTEGGTMHNKVVTMTARALGELGLDTLRFNFRGTGASQGTFDNGDGETDDLLAVAAWLRAQRPQHALWLAGFSFARARSCNRPSCCRSRRRCGAAGISTRWCCRPARGW